MAKNRYPHPPRSKTARLTDQRSGRFPQIQLRDWTRDYRVDNVGRTGSDGLVRQRKIKTSEFRTVRPFQLLTWLQDADHRFWYSHHVPSQSLRISEQTADQLSYSSSSSLPGSFMGCSVSQQDMSKIMLC